MKASFTPSSEVVDLLMSFYELSDATTHAIADVLAEVDLTQSQASMLWALAPGKDAMPMRDLARKLRCDPSNVTLMGDRLVTLGLVERLPHPTDGRRRILALTDQGLKVWTLLIERLQQRSPIFRLSTQEQARLSALLRKANAKEPLA